MSSRIEWPAGRREPPRAPAPRRSVGRVDHGDPAARLKTTKPTAGKAVQLLESLGVLTETSGKQRDRTFAYTAYLEKLCAGTELEGR